MYDSGIFVFGGKLFNKDTERNAIFSLPLEITWKIFSYLDDKSLQTVSHTHKMWRNIIISNKKLRNRLNKFELAIKLGSATLAEFYRKNKKKLKRVGKKYLPVGRAVVLSTERTVLKCKRRLEDNIVYTKRYKLF